MISLETTQHQYYTLDDAGNVVARSDGPGGWDYSGDWTIVGFLKRVHSHHMVGLADALNGVDIGHGYVVDLDHGHMRVWMGFPGRCKSVRRLP